MSLLIAFICTSFLYSNIESINVDQFFRPVRQLLTCSMGFSYQFLNKEYNIIECATTCATLYGCYALSQRFISPTTLCAVLLTSYICYKYHADEEIKNLFVDATNFIQAAIITATNKTHKRLDVLDKQTRKTHNTLLMLEIKIKAQAMQERIAMRAQFNKIEEQMQQQSDQYYLDMSRKLIELENHFDQKLAQIEYNIQKHITQTTHKLLAQNKKEIINSVQQQAAQMKDRQQNLMNEIHNVGTSTSLQAHEIGRCINTLMQQLELTNQTVANTQNMIHLLAHTVNTHISSSSQQPFERTDCKVPGYKPLVHNISPERLESDCKEDTLEQMVKTIKEQEEALFTQQKKEIQNYYEALQAQLSQERVARKQELDKLIKVHKAQTANQFKKAYKKDLAQQKQVHEQIDKETFEQQQVERESPTILADHLFTRKPSLVNNAMAYTRNISTLFKRSFTSLMLLLQKVSEINDLDENC